MIKETSRQVASTVFEGMTSLSAVIESALAGKTDRRITEVLYDRNKAQSKAKEIAYLRRMAEKLGFTVTEADAEEIDALATGNSHGGIIARCTERTIPALTAESLPETGFVVMIEGIEDPYNFGYALRSGRPACWSCIDPLGKVYAKGCFAVSYTHLRGPRDCS